ncbi:hypothetical protein EH31_01385 [Erythrobacter longus]|uniref:DUF883 domain-containing protein n=1 Tax=Erythrobacter longus TaxID=1044 RepID=A0A074MEZ9_ERYLO|nr:hypothetical protein [Erythrobacter longus]KEO91345.1 hypothetical protein EH31_01385 [Erythrobacter longus]
MTPELSQDETKRDALRQKIEANERRIAERTLGEQAKETIDAAVDYTRENPLKVIGGAVVIGLAIGLMTQPGRRVARKAASSAASAATGAASKVGGAASSATGAAASKVKTAAKDRTNAVWVLIGDALVGYAIKLIDDALGGPNAAKDTLEDLGDTAASKARSLRREASYLAGSAADKSRSATRRTKRRAERAVRDLTDRISH